MREVSTDAHADLPPRASRYVPRWLLCFLSCQELKQLAPPEMTDIIGRDICAPYVDSERLVRVSGAKSTPVASPRTNRARARARALLAIASRLPVLPCCSWRYASRGTMHRTRGCAGSHRADRGAALRSDPGAPFLPSATAKMTRSKSGRGHGTLKVAQIWCHVLGPGSARRGYILPMTRGRCNREEGSREDRATWKELLARTARNSGAVVS